MSAHLSQRELESHLWGAATLLRGLIDASDYKQYIFPLLFFKRLSDVWDEDYQRAFEEKEKLIVGVNAFQVEDEKPIDILYIPDDLAERQVAFLSEVRERRDRGAVERTLAALKQGAAGTENTMPLTLDCVKAYCTVGEVSDALRDVFGTYEEPAVF